MGDEDIFTAMNNDRLIEFDYGRGETVLGVEIGDGKTLIGNSMVHDGSAHVGFKKIKRFKHGHSFVSHPGIHLFSISITSSEAANVLIEHIEKVRDALLEAEKNVS